MPWSGLYGPLDQVANVRGGGQVGNESRHASTVRHWNLVMSFGSGLASRHRSIITAFICATIVVLELNGLTSENEECGRKRSQTPGLSAHSGGSPEANKHARRAVVAS